MIAAVLEQDPPSLRTLQSAAPEALDRVVRKCLAKDPDARWQTAQDLGDELRWIRDRASRETAGTSSNRTRIGWPVLAVAVTALAGLAAIVGSRRAPVGEPPAAVRFEVPPPPDVTFAESSAFLAVSPDGRSLAFTATRDGQRRLWVRALDATSARALEGTEGAGQPFWSADSSALAFWSGGKLRSVHASGGDVHVIADAPMIQAGTWNGAGLILFNRSDAAQPSGPGGFQDLRSRLYSASAQGTGASPVATDAVRSWPSFLPDGRRYLYLGANARSDLERGGTLYVGSLDSPERTALVESDSQGVFAAPGHLIYMRGTTLVAHAFDEKASRVTGTPVPIAELVERTPGSRRGAFSVSQTGVLAYRSVGATELAWFDRAGQQLGTVGPSGRYANPALSPDRRSVAVSRFDPDRGTSDIWVIDTTRNVASRLTADPSHDDMPLWSPDGRRIVFRSTRAPRAAVYQKASDGSGTERVLTDDLPGERITPMAWLPDGRAILVGIPTEGPSSTFWMVSSQSPSSRAPIFTSEATLLPICEVSPDGRWVAYVSNESGRSEVYVQRFPEGGSKRQVSINGGVEPHWRDDGREMFYLAADRSLMAVSIEPGADGSPGKPIPLFYTRMAATPTGGYTRNQYAVAEGGRRFLVNQTTGTAFPAPITVVVNWTARLAAR